MSKFFIAKMLVVLLFLIIFFSGVAALRSGKIRSRGHKFNRDENPIGYWSAVFVSLAGPVAIIYLLLTR